MNTISTQPLTPEEVTAEYAELKGKLLLPFGQISSKRDTDADTALKQAAAQLMIIGPREHGCMLAAKLQTSKMASSDQSASWSRSLTPLKEDVLRLHHTTAITSPML